MTKYSTYLIQDFYSKDVENSELNNEEPKFQIKMEKDLNRHFTKEVQIAIKYMKSVQEFMTLGNCKLNIKEISQYMY